MHECEESDEDLCMVGSDIDGDQETDDEDEACTPKPIRKASTADDGSEQVDKSGPAFVFRSEATDKKLEKVREKYWQVSSA